MTEAQKSNRRLIIIFIIALIIALLPWFVLAQSPIAKEKFNLQPQGENQAGYTQAVKVGNTIYVSGTVARGPMNEAIKKVYSTLELTLKNYNATLQHVVKENLHTTQLDEVIKHQDVRKEFYKGDYPTATWVEIKRLYSPDAVLEVEVVAVLPDQR